MIARILTCPLLVVCLQVVAVGQSAKPDTLFLAAADRYQRSLYNAAIGGQSRLYNGTEHRDYISRNDETPYFGIDDWQFGFIYYDDERYDSVAMFYDLSRDQVITEHVLTGAKIELIAQKISMFEINGHLFERLHKDSAGVITEGFHERLYDGGTNVYVRRTRILTSRPSSNEIIYSFEDKNRIYLRRNGKYFPVRSKRSVLNVLDDKRSSLRSVLKEEKIKFKKARERAIVLMARTYDSSPN